MRSAATVRSGVGMSVRRTVHRRRTRRSFWTALGFDTVPGVGDDFTDRAGGSGLLVLRLSTGTRGAFFEPPFGFIAFSFVDFFSGEAEDEVRDGSFETGTNSRVESCMSSTRTSTARATKPSVLSSSLPSGRKKKVLVRILTDNNKSPTLEISNAHTHQPLPNRNEVLLAGNLHPTGIPKLGHLPKTRAPDADQTFPH